MSTKLLDLVYSPKDLRKLSATQLPTLAKELRTFIIDIVATKEGHLGASLGVVELTIILHYLFDTPNDAIVWDVGHQAYAHKILTERKTVFHTNRQYKGIAGFPSRLESRFDSFGVGHSSTSISAVLGMAIASQLNGDEEKHHIAVIGDASIASGMAFEALNHVGVTNANMLIVLNDNAIGIDPSVGAFKDYLSHLKSSKQNTNAIETLFNIHYSGPIDGHDLELLTTEIKRLKEVKGPKILHIVTTKGKGLQQAEEHQVTYHAPGKFDAKTGAILPKKTKQLPPKYQDVFGKTLVTLAKSNSKIVGITPAMLTGSSLKLMLDTFPNRTFDVGIAEQHAVTLAAGMATQGLIPYCTIYSTFLQRAYDQVIHDVALQCLPVIFCIDRAGLVGEDGATHHGIFDLAILNCIPNLIIFAPRNEIELRNILFTAQLGLSKPIAIRYPRGNGVIIDWEQPFLKIEIGKGVQLKQGNRVAVLSIGSVAKNISDAIHLCNDISEIAHYDLRFLKPLDEKLLHAVFKNHQKIVTVEDGVMTGGLGSSVLAFAAINKYPNTVQIVGIPDRFIAHGTIDELQKEVGFDASTLAKLFSEI